MVGILLSRSTSILEISDGNGLTSLHVAAKNGQTEMFEEILLEQADKNTKNGKGYTPFHLASQFGHSQIVELIMKYSRDFDIDLNATDQGTI